LCIEGQIAYSECGITLEVYIVGFYIVAGTAAGS
jgi:hypothetical protein